MNSAAEPQQEPAQAGERLWLVALATVVVAFLVTRSLALEPVYFLGLDDPIYLALAEKLPHYSLYGGIGFVNHPPLFPILIRLAALGLPLPLAGLAAATGMEALAGYLLWRLLGRMGFGRGARTLALALLVLSTQWQRLAGMTYKETTYTALALGLLGAWLRVAEEHGTRGTRVMLVPMLWAGALVATSDHSVFAVAGGLGAAAAYTLTLRRWRWTLVLPAVAGAGAYLLWLAWRLHAYRSGPEAAVGLGGLLEPTTGIGLRQLVTPQSLPFTAALTDVRTSWPSFGELRNLLYGVFHVGPGRRLWVALDGDVIPMPAALGAVLALAGVAWLIRDAARHTDPTRRAFARALLVLGFVLCLPATQQIVRYRPRMFLVLPAVTSVGLAAGVAALGGRLRMRAVPGVVMICVAMALTCIRVARTMPYVTWFRPARVEAQAAIDWLNAQPPTAVMTQVGYSPEVGWRTHHRVYGMPTDGALLDAQVRTYGITYLVYGTHYWRAPDEDNSRPVWNGEAIAAVRAAPERYPLAATFEEVYMPPHRGLRGDTLWIHRVAPERIDDTTISP